MTQNNLGKKEFQVNQSYIEMPCLEKCVWGRGCWRNGYGSVIKSVGCSPRGLGFNSQCQRAGSQLSVTPVLGDPIPSSGLHKSGVRACRQTTRTHTKSNNKFKERIAILEYLLFLFPDSLSPSGSWLLGYTALPWGNEFTPGLSESLMPWEGTASRNCPQFKLKWDVGAF